MKAMAPELSQRYASAEEMLDDLKEFRKNPDFAPSAPDPEEEPDEPTMVVPTKIVTASVRVPPEHRDSEWPPQQERRQPRRREEEYDDYDYGEPARGGGVAAVAVAVVMILAFIGVVGYFLVNYMFKDMFAQPQEYEVPKLLGYTLEELERDKTIQGEFRIVEGPAMSSEEYEEGQICAQSPEAGTKVKEGSLTITVNVAGGDNATYLGSVVNRDAREVLKELQDLGLQVKQEQVFDDAITVGFVVSCSLVEGSEVNKGDEVTLYISKGPEKKLVTMPPLTGMTLERATTTLTGVGLAVGDVQNHYNDEYPEGQVYWQSEGVNKEVEKGTKVDLYVSDGPEPEPSAEPSPSDEPPASGQPSESGPLPDPTQDVGAAAGTKDITVDLSAYEGLVNVRIVVGNQEIHNTPVDADQNLTFTKRATASGEQMVYIYIDGTLVDSHWVDFRS